MNNLLESIICWVVTIGIFAMIIFIFYRVVTDENYHAPQYQKQECTSKFTYGYYWSWFDMDYKRGWHTERICK